jgi:pimeloyl-ACP methyl ester carboxylesterase
VTDSIPFDDFGGHGDLLHFAHANAYPPGSYRSFLSYLSQRHRVLAIKHRPLWIDSDPNELTHWDDIAQDTIEFFDQKGIRGAIGVGHSLGAVTTMMAAQLRPELFDSLVLIEPVFLLPNILKALEKGKATSNPQSWSWVLTALNRRNHWPSRQAAFAHFREKSVFKRWSDEAMNDFITHGIVRSADGGFVLAYDPKWEARIYSLPPTKIWDILPSITLRTLAVRGLESDTLSNEAWNHWQKEQTNTLFTEIPDTGHLLPMERPRYLADIISEFIEKAA